MDPLRDPLHDSVLDEALADTGLPAASSTEEAATGSMDDGAADEGADGASDAGDRSPSVDRGPGPHGPPPAVPVSHPLAWLYAPDLVSAISVRPPALPHGTTRTSHGPRPAETTTAGSSSSARGPPSAPHMPGEPDDPYWQRVMAVNVLNTLQHTGPAFVHAPTLATVRSWSSLRIILEEATEMDEVCCQRVDPQDLNNPLHMEDLPGTGEDADTENGEEEDGPAAEEGEEESNHSPDDDHDEAPDGHGPAGTPTTGAATTPGGTAPDGTAAPTDDSAGPAPGDPLHMIHSITDATASRHAFSTRPGDWVYEAEAVSFNLSAAHRCLEQTRRNVVALREGNRHRSDSDTADRSTGPSSGIATAHYNEPQSPDYFQSAPPHIVDEPSKHKRKQAGVLILVHHRPSLPYDALTGYVSQHRQLPTTWHLLLALRE
ncbi:hypothetical protein AK812_SmicGene13769 [Symbiodinium microadriaticum]|uniref:Uncharacterized protein n=1 Tax=Symbiodinium microadriaticum TaxID=2951 RepID=A0A1Q9E774_SYMMI|nr:hypothetical protein AK812_SmicGene13769 [Symbiodinium microadriaticum]